MSKRKDFTKKQVDLVYELQDRICKSCGRSLANGFARHHEDGDPSNNSIENLTLLCPSCHGGEAYQTLIKRKKKFLQDIDNLLKSALTEKISGTLIDKLTDLIKLGLSLNNQVYGVEIERPPASIRLENQLLASGLLQKEYEKGLRKGIELGADLVTEIRKKRRYS